jgi:hypothetical protein
MNWTDILGNVASGGLLGLLGNALTFGMKYFTNKQEFAMRKEMLTLEAQVAQSKTAGDIAVAREQGAAAGFAGAQQAEASIGKSYKWVEAVRSLTRPSLTVILIGLTSVIYFNTDDVTQSYIAQNIVTIAVAAVMFWFGSRASSETAWGNKVAGATVGTKLTK